LPEALLYLSSADNYVTVHTRAGEKLSSQLLRSSLKKMEEQLAGQPAFFRCHRMYIVNLQAVQSVSGNAQGLKLHLAGLEEAIPVSRSLTEAVKERLHQLSHSPQSA
jgi:DNA-binding LytR/AlgR family response regulator